MTDTTLLNTEALVGMNFDDMLDVNMSAIEKLPEYKTPDLGYYELSVPKIEQTTMETKDGDVEALKFTFSVERTIELNNPETGVAAEPGQLFTLTFPQGAGIQRLIKTFESVAQQNNCQTVKELLSVIPTIHINASIGHRFAKDDRKTKLNPYPVVDTVTQA